jgi:serine/threonine protein kinase
VVLPSGRYNDAVDLLDDLGAAAELAPWTLGPQIGRGGMGVVHRATEVATGAARAIKFIPLLAVPDRAADGRIRREVESSLLLDRETVVRAYTGGRAGSTYFLVMELCAGGNLADAVRRDGPLAPEATVAVLLDVLDGLAHAHSAPVPVATSRGVVDVTGLVHRDIKPPNIFVPAGGPAKIGDFGLAKAFATAGISGLTRTGMVAGTPAYMPRVQVLDYRDAPPAVDVWAAAASAYFALTGHSPRDFPAGRSPWRVVWDTTPAPIADRCVPVPPALARVLDEALDDRDDDLPHPGAGSLRAAVLAACDADGIRR